MTLFRIICIPYFAICSITNNVLFYWSLGYRKAALEMIKYNFIKQWRAK